MSFSEYLQVVNGFLESVPVNADVLKLDKALRSRTNRVHSAHIVFSFSFIFPRLCLSPQYNGFHFDRSCEYRISGHLSIFCGSSQRELQLKSLYLLDD